ncbi:S41 family peptidase [uncultured Microbulbifer sp.]|uniref:S41 family peptidase n=1 Tax=uncultured Microbulbifer sp. TaxID=348147 RepID=UPI0026297225|nr:S41 family peptidase [uncultured Microbulbifer sp.]
MRKLGFLLLITYLFTVCHCAYAVPASEVKQWIEDIDSYRQQLEEKHINLYHSVSKKEFVSALSRFKTSLADLNEQQLLVEMMRISRLIGDGHTQLAFWETDIGFYPFRFLNINGNLRLIASSEAYRYLLGYKLSAIDDIPIDEVVTRLSPVVQGVENAHSLKVRIAWQLNAAQILRGLSITDKPDRARFTFIDDSGHQKIVSVVPASLSKFHKKLTHFLFPRKIPFSEQKITASENLWMSADKDTKTAYIYFRRYPTFSNMENFAKDVKGYLENNKIKNLIIDLRNNGGGDFFVGLRMAWPLVLVDSLDWEHGVYTLIDNSTYSAAMSNAAQYRQLLNAKLVGEPTGGNPVGYQDMGQFSLPNSGWTITYSKRSYRFQEVFSEGVQPDVLIEQDWPSYLKGIDQSLAWVLDDIRKKTN